jgi:hypothetical protein
MHWVQPTLWLQRTGLKARFGSTRALVQPALGSMHWFNAAFGFNALWLNAR